MIGLASISHGGLTPLAKWAAETKKVTKKGGRSLPNFSLGAETAYSDFSLGLCGFDGFRLTAGSISVRAHLRASGSIHFDRVKTRI